MSAVIIVLTLGLVAAACAVTVMKRVDRLSTALDAATESSETLFATLLTDPATAEAELVAVRSALDDAQDEFAAFPMPQLGWVPGLRDDLDAADEALTVADTLVDEVAPTLIDVATVVDLETGSLRNPATVGWGASFGSIGDIATEGAEALDSLCAAADSLDAVDLSGVMDAVSHSIDDFRTSVRDACDDASEYGPVLEALDSGGDLLTQLVDDMRDDVSGLEDALRDIIG
ncbi:hypothetical protein BJEO58_01323 [Brevibacterium jeotgali]|uniref:Uncharacterized protein n=1 Tax=Brevibacterium jeotgali TaxID=1262550 RepID=A0A2H1L4A7_9MICO|nr:hypothetical protein FB108_2559 [Brevibacterium jeotgali]SMY11736.1 hypothetical protein BJEO58_01323 [Brevibacterium jeotgali]